MGQFASMTRVIGGLGLGCLICFALAACSSDGESNGHGGAGSDAGGTTSGAGAGAGAGGASAGTAGKPSQTGGAGSASGGSMSGGAGSSSGGAHDGGAAGMPGGHCSPGTLSRVDDKMSLISTCEGYDPYLIKQPKGTPIFVYDVAIDPQPPADAMTALSVQFSSGQHPKMELWTTGQECGSADQRMGTATAGPGVACIERTGANPSPHFVLVLYEDAPLEQITLCQTGSCP